MRRITELIDRRDAREPVAAIDQNARVARKGRGIAGYGDHERYARRGERARLRLGTLARWVEYDGVEAFELACHQRAAEEVARLRRNRLQSWSSRGGPAQRRDCGSIAVDSGDAG